jgi:hypothetical protein
VRLPEEHARTLIRLARLGHRQGLQHALGLLAEEHPDCAPQVALLRVLVERFAWGELVDQLTRAIETTDAEAL